MRGVFCMKMTKEEAQEIAKKIKENSNKYGLPVKKKTLVQLKRGYIRLVQLKRGYIRKSLHLNKK